MISPSSLHFNLTSLPCSSNLIYHSSLTVFYFHPLPSSHSFITSCRHITSSFTSSHIFHRFWVLVFSLLFFFRVMLRPLPLSTFIYASFPASLYSSSLAPSLSQLIYSLISTRKLNLPHLYSFSVPFLNDFLHAHWLISPPSSPSTTLFWLNSTPSSM